jgi:hypothetical protein
MGKSVTTIKIFFKKVLALSPSLRYLVIRMNAGFKRARI